MRDRTVVLIGLALLVLLALITTGNIIGILAALVFLLIAGTVWTLTRPKRKEVQSETVASL